MSAVPQTIGGRFDGGQAALLNDQPLWFVVKVDTNLLAQFTLFHRDADTQRWDEIASGRGSMSVRVDQAVANLHLDSIGWIVLCSPLNAGTFPVHVQLFQGADGSGFAPVTRIAQYDVTVGAGNALQPINDWVKLV